MLCIYTMLYIADMDSWVLEMIKVGELISVSVSQSVIKITYIAQLSSMTPEATLKPVHYKFMPKTVLSNVITNVLCVQVC